MKNKKQKCSNCGSEKCYPIVKDGFWWCPDCKKHTHQIRGTV